ncbi:MAG: WD40/YVTN/BNR-like repeat-containing protein, partial [Gemmatimonadales bacterium]
MPSRRDFLVSAGQAGVAMSALSLARAPRLHSSPAATEVPAATPPGDVPIGLDWRMLGPFRGGRTDAVCGVPGRPNEFYFGHVNGGVWKTIDGGRSWAPVFDGQEVASVGALAVAPSAPDVVYVGSGESTLRDSVGFGNGVYKSADAGRTWTHLGLDETQHIGKIAVDPRN